MFQAAGEAWADDPARSSRLNRAQCEVGEPLSGSQSESTIAENIVAVRRRTATFARRGGGPLRQREKEIWKDDPPPDLPPEVNQPA
jgi:hypothetical protein